MHTGCPGNRGSGTVNRIRLTENAMSDRILINDMKAPLDLKRTAEYMHISEDSDFYDELAEAVEKANEVARPRAVLKWVDVDEIGDGYAVLDGVRFDSRVMADKLKGSRKVFFFAITAGDEVQNDGDIEDSMGVLKDMLTSQVLGAAYAEMMKYVRDTFGNQKIAFMTPGSLPDWNMQNNFALIGAIGGVKEDLGITMNPTGAMIPFQSGSGIIFADDTGYTNCSLCRNLDCIGRRVPFDESEYIRIFGEAPGDQKV